MNSDHGTNDFFSKLTLSLRKWFGSEMKRVIFNEITRNEVELVVALAYVNRYEHRLDLDGPENFVMAILELNGTKRISLQFSNKEDVHDTLAMSLVRDYNFETDLEEITKDIAAWSLLKIPPKLAEQRLKVPR
jgi:hypothetical protein